MEKRELGTTGIQMTVMGFGCASAWSKTLITDEQAEQMFLLAYEQGIRYFDTSYSYDLAERRIGNILKNNPSIRREELVISTKFGTKNDNGKYYHDFSPEWMRESVQASLERMGLDYADMLLIHGPQISDLTPEYLTAINELKAQGITRAIGINTFDTDVIEYIRDTHCVDFVMLDYSILRQDREPLIQSLHDNGIGIIAGAPLAESLFTNRVFKVRKMKDVWYLARALVNHRDKMLRGRKYTFVNKVPGMTGTQIALKYVLDNPNVTTAVFGTTTPAHLIDNVGAEKISIPEAVVRRIRTAEK